jgi:hypothetical protein
MRYSLKGATIALLLSSAMLATTGIARADHYYGNDRQNGAVTIQFGNIAYGYRDGYWDNGHRWHRWHHRNDYRGYRDQNGSNYHDMNHDREDNNGWQRH